MTEVHRAVQDYIVQHCMPAQNVSQEYCEACIATGLTEMGFSLFVHDSSRADNKERQEQAQVAARNALESFLKAIKEDDDDEVQDVAGDL